MESDDLGKRLRQVREYKGKSLRDISRSAELSPASLSAIENGKSSPTLATLNKILKALGSDLVSFFAADEADRAVSPVFAAREMRRIADPSRKYTILFPKHEGFQFEVLRETIAPTEGAGEWETHDCDMGGLLLGGGPLQLEITGRGSWTIAAGDAFYIPTRQRHRAVNVGKTPAELITIFCPPRY